MFGGYQRAGHLEIDGEHLEGQKEGVVMELVPELEWICAFF